MLTFNALQQALTRITYRDWHLELYEHPNLEGTWLAITATLPNSYRPDEMTTVCIKTAVPPIPTGEYFHHWLRWRIHRVESHEVNEWFKVDGVPVFDPHAEAG